MNLAELCEKIGLQPQVTREVLSHARDCPASEDLRTSGRWQEGLAALPGEDPLGFKGLTVSLNCALETWDEYRKLGLSEEIFAATMGCFSRFVGEHMESFGTYGFDRQWWTVRQLSCRLFRIGELEYELAEQNGERIIALHIPSDAKLRDEALRASYDSAKVLIPAVFPDWAEKPMVCHSWLLSPALKEVLPENSRILRFQRSFRITPTGQETDDYRTWVYKCSKLPLEQLQEDTTLQRNLKRYLMAGGKFPDARGILIDEPFVG